MLLSRSTSGLLRLHHFNHSLLHGAYVARTCHSNNNTHRTSPKKPEDTSLKSACHLKKSCSKDSQIGELCCKYAIMTHSTLKSFPCSFMYYGTTLHDTGHICNENTCKLSRWQPQSSLLSFIPYE